MDSFKKQEYIHMHNLLSEVATYLDESRNDLYRNIEDTEAYQEYLENGVEPTSIHRSKSDHKESVYLLAESIDDFLSGEEKSLQR